MGVVMWIVNLFSGGKVKAILAAVAALAGVLVTTFPTGPVHQASIWVMGVLSGLGILSGGTEATQPPAVKAAVEELRAARAPAAAEASPTRYDPTAVP